MTLRGLTFAEYGELLKYSITNNSYSGNHNSPVVKYVDCSFDTRTMTIWKVKFWGFGTRHEFATNTLMAKCATEIKFDNLYDWISNYLNNNLSMEELEIFETSS